MPVRTRKNRRRRSANVTPEAISLFRRGLDNPTQETRIALAEALGRSKFRASPLDREPRSLIGCDTEPIAEVREIQKQLLEKIGEGSLP
jgi:transcriptional regulator with XRE-family HTH domain